MHYMQHGSAACRHAHTMHHAALLQKHSVVAHTAAICCPSCPLGQARAGVRWRFAACTIYTWHALPVEAGWHQVHPYSSYYYYPAQTPSVASACYAPMLRPTAKTTCAFKCSSRQIGGGPYPAKAPGHARSSLHGNHSA